MTAPPWFKVHAAKTLLSADLEELTQAEECAWWRLLCVVSLEEERGRVRVSKSLAKHLRLTRRPHMLMAFLRRVEALGMVTLTGDLVTVVNWERFQERDRPPSWEPEANRERQQRTRARKRDLSQPMSQGEVVTVTTPVTIPVTENVTTEEEGEEEKREKKRGEGDLIPLALPVVTARPGGATASVIAALEQSGIPTTRRVCDVVDHWVEGETGVASDWFLSAIEMARERGKGRNLEYIVGILRGFVSEGGPPAKEQRNGRSDGNRGTAAAGKRAAEDDPYSLANLAVDPATLRRGSV